MKRANLLLTTALTAASMAYALPANADGKTAGTIDVGVSYFDLQDWDDQATSIHASGAVLKRFNSGFSGQGDFAFIGQHFDCDGCSSWSVDTYRLGFNGFWRDPSWGLYGFELAYQAIDDGKAGSGFRAGVRGELFFDRWTIAGATGHLQNSEDGCCNDFDGWYLDTKVSFYPAPQWGLSGRFERTWLDRDNSGDLEQWDLTGEAEYLFEDCDTSLYAAVTVGDQDWGGEETDEVGIMIGGRWYFGTEGPLIQRYRTGTLQPTLTGMRADY